MALTIQVLAGADYTTTLANEDSLPMVDAVADITGPKFTGQVLFNRTGNDLYRWDGAQWVVMSALRIQTADGTAVNNSTTLISSTQLTVPVGANTNYLLEMGLIHTSSTVADIKIGLAVPAGSTTPRIATWTSGVAAAAISDAIFHDALDATSFAGGGLGVGQMFTTRPWAWFTTGATAGNVVLQYAQNTAEASNTILKAGSWMRVSSI